MSAQILGAWMTKFCLVAPDIFSLSAEVLLLPYETVYHFACTELVVPDNSEVHKSLQNFGSSVWSLLNDTLQGPQIWNRPLDFC